MVSLFNEIRMVLISLNSGDYRRNRRKRGIENE
jgi:hypothetical protein